MLKKENLLNLNYVPNESNIDIRTIQEFYENYLMPYIFKYQLNDDLAITLKFHKTNFCHLLGLHYITSSTMHHIKYEGDFGYKKIRDEGLSFEKLEAINKHEFDLNRNRILYFPFVYQLLQNPYVIEFDKAKVKKCSVDCKLMFYDEYHNVNIHLGVRSKNGDFFPVTFLVEPIGNTYKGDKFLKSQRQRKIYKVEIVERWNVSIAKEISEIMEVQRQVAAIKEKE